MINPLSLLLTFIQIVYETIPVSSSAHVIIVKKIYTTLVDAQAQFPADLYQLSNIPTLIVIIIYFRQSLWSLWPWSSDNNGQIKFNAQELAAGGCTLALALISCAITIFCYFGTKKMLSEIVSPPFLITSLTITALILYSLKWSPVASKSNLCLQDALLIGVAQSVSLLPGISRFAATYASARWLGISNHLAIRYSFLMHGILNSILITKILYCKWPELVAIVMQRNFEITLIACIAIGCLLSYRLLIFSDSLGKQNQFWKFSYYLPVPIVTVLALWLLNN